MADVRFLRQFHLGIAIQEFPDGAGIAFEITLEPFKDFGDLRLFSGDLVAQRIVDKIAHHAVELGITLVRSNLEGGNTKIDWNIL